MLERLDTLPVPVIGRIQGAALGGGVGLAAVCDIVVAARRRGVRAQRGEARHSSRGHRSLRHPRRLASRPRANCS